MTEVKTHWNKPHEGESISYKEIVAYSLGGFGKELVGVLMTCFGLAVTNLFLGFAVGIRATHLFYMSTVVTVVNMFFPFVRAKIIDNTRTKWGRFRPYIAFAGFIVVGLGILLVYLPYDKMAYISKVLVITGLTVVQSFAIAFLNETYEDLRMVMTSNGAERTKLISISSILWSFAPTITGLLIPLLAGLHPHGFSDIKLYQQVYVIFGCIGVGFAFFAAIGTKERVVAAKAYVPRVNVMHGVGQIFKNKYWWMQKISEWCQVTKLFWQSIIMWLFVFKLENYTMWALVSTAMGTGALIAMIVTPIIINKIGSTRSVILQGFLSLGTILLMWATVGNIWLFIVANYIAGMVNNMNIVISPVVSGNMKDYQQYISGKRMDYTFRAAGVIGVPITMLTAYIFPFLCESFGFTGNSNVFYDARLHTTFFTVLFILSVVGAVAAFLPYFFYDLTDAKHRELVGVLKLRAIYADLADGSCTDKQIMETVNQVERARKSVFDTEKMLGEDPNCLDLKGKQRAYLHALFGFKFKEYKSLRREFNYARRIKEEYDGAILLVSEMHKFNTPLWILKAQLAERLTKKTVADLAVLDTSFTADAQAMPEGTESEKECKAYALRFAQRVEAMASRIQKNYPQGLAEFDMTRLNDALALPQDTKEQLRVRNAIIKDEDKKLYIYNNTVRLYNEAKELLHQKESYTRYEEVEEKYAQIAAANDKGRGDTLSSAETAKEASV